MSQNTKSKKKTSYTSYRIPYVKHSLFIHTLCSDCSPDRNNSDSVPPVHNAADADTDMETFPVCAPFCSFVHGTKTMAGK